ncbi:MAG: ribonuclease HI [Clostridia bacterium]|nr:ribonuclease HI [Clostridia bacterium]
MKKVVLYTDGACSGNPGIGGWACILMYKKHKKQISSGEQMTTNNRMELTAVIEGLKLLKEKCNVEIYSDSAYIVNAINKDWLTQWQLRGWKTANKDAVQNQDLWEELLTLLAKHKTTFIKVKGHSDNEYNNECDRLAVEEVKKIKTIIPLN